MSTDEWWLILLATACYVCIQTYWWIFGVHMIMRLNESSASSTKNNFRTLTCTCNFLQSYHASMQWIKCMHSQVLSRPSNFKCRCYAKNHSGQLQVRLLFFPALNGTVSAKIALRLKCYKNASRLNRYNFPTDKAIDFLFSTLHTTPFHYEVLKIGSR